MVKKLKLSRLLLIQWLLATYSVQCFSITKLNSFDSTVSTGLISEQKGSDGTLFLTAADDTVLAVHEKIIHSLTTTPQIKIVVLAKSTDFFQEKFKIQIRSGQLLVLALESNDISLTGYQLPNWSRDFVGVGLKPDKNKKVIITLNYKTNNVLAGREKLQLAYQAAISKQFKNQIEFKSINIYGEWGNAIFDDKGQLFLTERTLQYNMPAVNRGELQPEKAQSANPDAYEKLRKNIEIKFLSAFKTEALKNIVWLPSLPSTEESTGHIDMYASIVESMHVVVSKSTDAEKEKTLDQIAAIFAGKGYKVDRLSLFYKKADPSFYSYTNTLRLKDQLFIPSYFDSKNNNSKSVQATDKAALEYYSNLKLYKKIVQIPVYDQIQRGGAIHCLTSFVPFYLW